MIGDPTLFMRADVVGQGWRIMPPVLDARAARRLIFLTGSDGPKATDELLTDDGGRAWRPVSLSSEQKP
jgi:glucose-6-phosphate 1-dehydrogenase